MSFSMRNITWLLGLRKATRFCGIRVLDSRHSKCSTEITFLITMWLIKLIFINMTQPGMIAMIITQKLLWLIFDFNGNLSSQRLANTVGIFWIASLSLQNKRNKKSRYVSRHIKENQ